MSDTLREVVTAITGAHRLIKRFGSWPTFHDFEVVSLQFDRGNLAQISENGNWTDKKEPSLAVMFYGFDIRYAHDHPDRQSSWIEMRFYDGLYQFSLDGFNHQNPITGLQITSKYSEELKRDLFAVRWGGTCSSHEVSFLCGQIEVVSVEATRG